MATYVAKTSSCTSASWVSAPICLLIVRHWLGQPTLQVVAVYPSNSPQLTLLNERSGLPNHWVTGVIMSQREIQTALAHFALQGQSLVNVKGHGFVTDHMKPRRQRCHRHGIMQMIGRGNHHKVHALVLRQLLLR